MYYGKQLSIKYFQGQLGMIFAEGTTDDRGCHFVHMKTKSRIRVSQLVSAIEEFNRLNLAENAMNLQSLFGHPAVITTKMKRISNAIQDRIITDGLKADSTRAWTWRCDDDKGKDAQRRDLERLEQDIRVQEQVMAENPDAFLIGSRRRRSPPPEGGGGGGRIARQRTGEPPPEVQQLEQMRSELEVERAAALSLRAELNQVRSELEAERAACAELQKFKTKHADAKDRWNRMCKDIGGFMTILRATYPENTFKRDAPQPPPQLPLSQETIDSVDTMSPEDLRRLIRRQFNEGQRWQRSHSQRDQTTLKLTSRLVELEEQLAAVTARETHQPPN